MRSFVVIGFGVIALLVVVLGAGCREGEPKTELDIFADWATGLETQTMVDTLRTLSLTEGDQAMYADFVLGNYFYEMANDSAMVQGWNQPPVMAMMDSAATRFESAVERDTTFVEGLVNLGSVWDDRSQQMAVSEVRAERTNLAEDYYRRALAVDPTDEKARCNLGGLYMRQRQTEKALAEFKAVLEQNPESALAHYNLAIMFAESKIYREAIVEWELAAKYDADGDIGERSRENIKIVDELMNAPLPKNVQ